jgi:hypothetical protein
MREDIVALVQMAPILGEPEQNLGHLVDYAGHNGMVRVELCKLGRSPKCF